MLLLEGILLWMAWLGFLTATVLAIDYGIKIILGWKDHDKYSRRK